MRTENLQDVCFLNSEARGVCGVWLGKGARHSWKLDLQEAGISLVYRKNN